MGKAARKVQESKGVNYGFIEAHPSSAYSHISPEALSPSIFNIILKLSRLLYIPAIIAGLALAFFFITTASSDDLEAIQQFTKLTKEPKSNPDLLPNVDYPPSLSDQQSQIKFISGLIAMHRPNIKDCGAVAKEIVELSALENIDPFYVAAVISVESRFGTEALSHAGALGLMQLMPSTAKEISQRKTGKKSYPRLKHPRTNIELGISYLKQLEKKYKGDRFLVLSAYNWGQGNVDRARKAGKAIPKSVQRYANTVTERSQLWANHYAKAKEGAAQIGQASGV
jgi:hypothetical protein